jgi:hypothetical protein
MERDHEPHSDFARGQEEGKHDEEAESDFARGRENEADRKD